ncbi:MAG: hypothetical protein Athens101426_303 [Parcubacteria group bacterium Athens1014_26]|nr:MAG: hypothetical protein Athens101426_303 [Parcubacteria group bacterium Athens1014_26]
MSTTVPIIKQIIGGPSDFGIGWIIILISSVIAILVAFATFSKWLYEKIQKKRRFLKTLSLLTIGTNIDYFKTLLGNPVFINKVGNYDEFIFVNPYFYVQAIVNSQGKIVLFSITTRNKRFNPILNIGGGDFSVKLGKTTFSKLMKEPEKVFKRGGDHGGFDFYSEVYYFGNPGHYLNYAFSINENVYDAFSYVPLSFLENTPDNPDEIKKFRNENIINTYTVIGSLEEKEIEENGIEFGPMRSQIRTLN